MHLSRTLGISFRRFPYLITPGHETEENPMRIHLKTINYLVILTAFIVALASGMTAVAQEKVNSAGQGSAAAAKSSKISHPPCGGSSAMTCPGGMKCIDNPTDNCDPAKDGINCPGLCVGGTSVSKAKQPCGGPGGIACPGGMACVDDTADNCDPAKGGIDCIGMCMGKP
jgi:hypothetical protein